MRTLRLVELETADEHRDVLAAKAAASKEARRVAWDRVYDACEKFDDMHQHPFVGEVVAAARAIDKPAQQAAKERGEKYKSIGNSAVASARYSFLWGRELRNHLLLLIDRLRALVDDHGVQVMNVPLSALEMLHQVAEREDAWLPAALEQIIALGAIDDPTGVQPISHQSRQCIDDLAQVANGQRSIPHEPDDVDLFVSRISFFNRGGPREVDMLSVFTRLVDLIEDFNAGRLQAASQRDSE